MPLLTQSLLVALGGAAGALARFWMALIVVRFAGGPAPLATFVVNVVGCAMAGALLARTLGRDDVVGLQSLILIGFLGGLTTFSSFSLDTLSLVRAGQGKWALLYVCASVFVSLGAAALAFALMRRM